MSRVALFHCDSIEQIPAKIEMIINSLGKEKISGLFRNKKVLLKPNICIDLPPERGGTTHPAVLDAMLAFTAELGAKVIVGDGPVIGIKGKIFEKTGILDVCNKYGVELLNLNRVPGKVVRLDDGLVLKEALIAETYFEVDTVINLALLKSNLLYWLSGALKNMKGLLVGTEKHKAHHLGVAKSVADLNRMLKQDLVIMDGSIGMMGNGPSAGPPANAGLLLGGFDPVAVDTVAAELMGLPVDKIQMIKYAQEVGVGSTEYEIIGDPLDSFDLHWKKPQIAKMGTIISILESALNRFFPQLRKRSRMTVDFEKCNLCGGCMDMCPFHAVTIEAKTVRIDRQKCDLCLCCMEVCTKQAINFRGLMSHTDMLFH